MAFIPNPGSLIPITGKVKFSDIEKEFGQGNDRSMGDYRRSNTYADMVLPIADGIPTSGQISFGQFRGKEVTMMVNCYDYAPGDKQGFVLVVDSDGNPQIERPWVSTRANIKKLFDQGRVHVVGENLTKDVKTIGNGNGGGKIVYVQVNKVFQSQITGARRDKCALVTGKGWDTGTQLRIEVAGRGVICGSGGNGGHGGSYGSNAFAHLQKGKTGTSALGIQHSPTSVTVMKRDTPYKVTTTSIGLIAAGLPGGGGGGAVKIQAKEITCGWELPANWIEMSLGAPASDETVCLSWLTNHQDVWSGGGGGGGGQGWPSGRGGRFGNSCGRFSDPGTSCRWPDGISGGQGLWPYPDYDGYNDDFTKNNYGSHAGDGAVNTLTLANGSVTTRGGDGGDGARWYGTPQAYDGSSPSYTSSVPTTQVALANPGPGASYSSGGVVIADQNHTNWSVGTWHDGSRVFGNVAHIAPANN